MAVNYILFPSSIWFASGWTALMLAASLTVLYLGDVPKHSAQLYHHLFIVLYPPLVSPCVPKPYPSLSDENALRNVGSKQVRGFSTPTHCLSTMPVIWQGTKCLPDSKTACGPLTCACLFVYCICSGCISIWNLNSLANRPSEFEEMLLINVSISQSLLVWIPWCSI